MRKFITILYMCLGMALSFSSAYADELSLSYEISKNNKIEIAKTYPGEPVSTPRRMVITHHCGDQKTEIYNHKACDFDQFELKASSLSFVIRYYDPDSGICTDPEVKKVNLTLNCQK